MIRLFLKDGFNFMATLNHTDLLEIEMVVERLYLSVSLKNRRLLHRIKPKEEKMALMLLS